MKWFDWNHHTIPCQFDADRTRGNEEFLERILGFEFLNKALGKKKPNPIKKLWNSSSANSYLKMNALAEDLRIVCDKTGFTQVLSELRDSELCLPTWHMIHSAALFERARAGAVLEFFNSGNEETPDFLVRIGEQSIPVEAKHFNISRPEEIFHNISRKILDQFDTHEFKVPPETSISIILKKKLSEDYSAPVIQFCKTGFQAFESSEASRQKGVIGKSEICNVFIQSAQNTRGMADYKWIHIYAPVPDSENTRIIERAKKANRQLKTINNAERSGILCIGLNGNNNGLSVFQCIGKEIRNGNFGGISAVLLVKSQFNSGPPIISTVDNLEIWKNNAATSPIHAEVPLKPLGLSDLITRNDRHFDGIKVYKAGTAHGRIVDASNCRLTLPEFDSITQEMID